MQMASLKHIAYTHKSNILLKENMFLLLRQIKIIGPNFYHEHCTFLYYLAKKKIALQLQNSRMSYLLIKIYHNQLNENFILFSSGMQINLF
ncbi:hypothetical protein P8452_19922 [Trifolium repens]|nr:hypothetical protein P8452_19922 [Trifolium repens]